MNAKKLFDITLPTASKEEILEQIKKYINSPKDFYHIVSLNPENMVLTTEDNEFKEVVTAAQMAIIDGVGVVTAAQILGIPSGERFAGVDLMQELIEMANKDSLSVVLIGGKGKVAEDLSKCYSRIHGQIKVIGIEGFKNIQNPTENEEKEIFSIVAATRPHFIFVAFGSPWQEKWIYRNRASLQGVVCMGVGGGFDYVLGRVSRAPGILRVAGFEWLYRLIRQPWRWRRQLRLIKFMWLVFLSRFGVKV